ncbi:MAG: NADH-quinone oxidoreductase subunit N [Planctomycetota bacterium]
MSEFTDKLAGLWPEMVMLVGATACLASGLSPWAAVRRATPWVAAGTMALAWGLTVGIARGGDASGGGGEHPLGFGGMVPYVKCLVLAMGLILLMVNAGVPERLRQDREAEEAKAFDPGNAVRGEYYFFFLLSLTGAMMTAGATDLVWLFLALELTSLPTYVMIAMSRGRVTAQESAIKYFFLGALSAAVFLYGFALIYGATGFTDFARIASSDGVESPLFVLGLSLAILGLCFKIAAVPMHLYAADVYEGAATQLTAFLAVVPKTAGFAALVLVVGLTGWDPLPEPIALLLSGVAILTMTLGNVLAIVQTNLKRVLAYSSIAHSGYLLTGLVAGLGSGAVTADGSEAALGNGVAALLFYLLTYAMATVGSFAVIACLRVPKLSAEEEAEVGAKGHRIVTYEHLAGLWWRSPALAGVMLVAMLSLVGLPPLAGFLGKVYLIGGVFTAGYGVLAVAIVINSAASAGYYLRIAMACFFGKPAEDVRFHQAPTLIAGAGITTVAAFVLGGYGASGVVQNSLDATPHAPPRPAAAAADGPEVELPPAENDGPLTRPGPPA